jgi:hypothetical protein
MNIESSGYDSRRPGIDLDIAGEGLLLSGRFMDWESGVSMGPDLDQLFVRLAVDATSASASAAPSWPARPAGQAAGTPAGALPSAETPVLFSFRGRETTELSSGLYRVSGQFTGPTVSKTAEVQVETSVEHNAVFVLSFQARKSDFGTGWTRLLSNLVPLTRRDEGPPRPASGWLTPPHLAAA